MLEYREGPFEGGLEPVTAIWILDARAPPEPVPRGPNIRSIGYQEIHPRQDRVHPAIACFSYGAGVFGTAKAEVAFLAPLVTLPPSLPLPNFSQNQDLHDSAGWSNSNTPSGHPSHPRFISSVVAVDVPPCRRRSLRKLCFGYNLAVWCIPREAGDVCTVIRSRRLPPRWTPSSPHPTNWIGPPIGPSRPLLQHLPFTRKLGP